MFTARTRRLAVGGAVAAVAALALSACASSNPLEPGDDASSGGADGDTIVVGSQGYYSNEIIAEIYAQALENAGMTVERQFQIGQRDAYMPSIESGSITVFPEYTGNLLQFFDPEATVTSPDEVYAALQDALPDGLAVLEQSSATDQDTYTVTKAFADQYDLTTIADLANVDVPLTVGGYPEFAERPYGPDGALSIYDVTVGFEATGDTTLDSLLDGSTINIGDIFTASPAFETEDIVALEDPEQMILASNVVPLVQGDRADELAAIIDPISAALTPEGLVSLNVESTVDQKSAADIAKAWLEANDLV